MRLASAYKISNFLSASWWERAELEGEAPRLRDVIAEHIKEGDVIDHDQCGDLDYFYFLHSSDGIAYYAYLYKIEWTERCAPNGVKKTTWCAEPFMWVYGTKFDGVRESEAAPHFYGGLLEMSKALKWFHNYLRAKGLENDE